MNKAAPYFSHLLVWYLFFTFAKSFFFWFLGGEEGGFSFHFAFYEIVNLFSPFLTLFLFLPILKPPLFSPFFSLTPNIHFFFKKKTFRSGSI